MRIPARGLLAVAVCVIVNVGLASGASAAPFIVPMDTSLTFLSVADLASHTDCTPIPGGAKAGTDGWVFTQPLTGFTEVAYGLGFIVPGDAPTAYVFRIDASGISNVPLGAAASAALAPPAKLAAGDLPAGVDGALIDGGAGGVWVQTPAGWIIGGGAEGAEMDPNDVTSFGLASVCPPLTTSPPASASASVSSPPRSESVSPSPPPASNGPSLPVTGEAIGIVVAIGSAFVVLGIALRLVRKRGESQPR